MKQGVCPQCGCEDQIYSLLHAIGIRMDFHGSLTPDSALVHMDDNRWYESFSGLTKRYYCENCATQFDELKVTHE
jgi:hypothetical protein